MTKLVLDGSRCEHLVMRHQGKVFEFFTGEASEEQGTKVDNRIAKQLMGRRSDLKELN